MAYTKIIPITRRLDNAVNYVLNPAKTDLANALDYTMDADKTISVLFVSAYNCRSDHAFSDMGATKKRWGKQGPRHVRGYHIIQSFAPGETSPEQAHHIGQQFAEQYLAGKYEVIVTTHLDKEHLHNHIVFNSVSFQDGAMFRNKYADYYQGTRAISDQLCRDNGLSVIVPQDKDNLPRAAWQAEQEGRPTVRGLIREDIDRVISRAYNFTSFLELLAQSGYEIKRGRHLAVKPPDAQRFIRLRSLGEGYSEDEIRSRLAARREGQEPPNPGAAYALLPAPPKTYRPKSPWPRPRRKIRGFLALYWKYMYLLGKVKRRTLPPKAAIFVRRDVLKLERYQRQFRYLYTQDITDLAQLQAKMKLVEAEIAALIEERHPLYQERRTATDEREQTEISDHINSINQALRERRRELSLCQRIQEDAEIIAAKLQQSQAAGRRENLNSKEKDEVKQDERRR